MKITNNFNLPQALVDKCVREKHNSPHCISATSLKNGTRAFYLTDRHFDEIEVDASDMLWAVFGDAFHSLMDKESEDVVTEKDLSYDVDGWKVTGRVDGYNTKTGEVYDWKTTSVWKVVNGDFDEWKFQGLVYAWLLRKNGLIANKCRFIACLKDHSKSKAKFDKSYPQKPIYVYEFDVTDDDIAEIEKTIKEKVADIAKCENVKDDDLPLCNESERWTKCEFAVMKDGRKTAVRVFKDDNAKELAEKLASEVGGYVVDRSTDAKCNGYCQCCEFCSHWKANYKDVEKGAENGKDEVA